MAYHFLRYAAQPPALEACIAVGTQHDEIGVQRLSSRQDRRSYRTDERLHFCRDADQFV